MPTASASRGYIFIFLGMFLWSTAEVVVRFCRADIPPIPFAFIRFALGTLILLCLLPGDLRRKRLRLDRRVWKLAFWLCIPGIVFNSIAFQFALTLAGAGIVATAFGTTPLVVFLLSYWVLGEPLDWGRIAGMLLGFVGVVILSMSKISESFSYAGLALALFTVASFALFTVFVKKSAGPYSGLPITTLCFSIGTLMLLPVTLASGWDDFHFPPYTVLALILYLGVGCTGFAYLFYFKGLETVNPTTAAAIILLKPPLATLFAAIVLGEPVSWQVVVAMMLISAGLYLVIRLQRARFTEFK